MMQTVQIKTKEWITLKKARILSVVLAMSLLMAIFSSAAVAERRVDGSGNYVYD